MSQVKVIRTLTIDTSLYNAEMDLHLPGFSMWPLLQKGHKSKGDFGISAALEGKLLGADFHSYSTEREESSRRKIFFGQIKDFSFLGKKDGREGIIKKQSTFSWLILKSVVEFLFKTLLSSCGVLFIINRNSSIPFPITFWEGLDSHWAVSSAEPSDELDVSNWVSFQVNLNSIDPACADIYLLIHIANFKQVSTSKQIEFLLWTEFPIHISLE